MCDIDIVKENRKNTKKMQNFFIIIRLNKGSLKLVTWCWLEIQLIEYMDVVRCSLDHILLLMLYLELHTKYTCLTEQINTTNST